MGAVTRWMTCCFATLTVVIAMPFIETSPTLSLEQVKEQCNAFSMKQVLSQINMLPTRDSLQLQGNDFKSGEEFSIYSSDQDKLAAQIENVLGVLHLFPNMKIENEENSDMGDLLMRVLTEFRRIRNECILKLVNQNDADVKLSGMMDDQSMSRSGTSQRSIGQLIGVGSEGSKRASGLALNPTGWRKRRATPRNSDELRQLLENMRQLLQKRERLPVHATGW